MTALFFIIVLLSFLGYLGGKNKALRLGAGKDRKLKSLPAYHGAYVALWCFIPSILLIILWFLFNDAWLQMLVIASLPNEFKGLSPNKLSLLLSEVRNISSGFDSVSQISGVTDQIFQNYLKLKSLLFNAIFTTVALVSLTGLYYSNNKISVELNARQSVEQLLLGLFVIASLVALLTTIGIIFSLIFESLRFFEKVSLFDFLFGLEWSPQIAIREDQVAAKGAFGIVPLLLGTFLTTLIAMFVAVPIGLFSAIYLAEYANPKFRAVVKPALEILAGIPTVVYGFFAAITVAPMIRSWGAELGLDVASESALAAGLVMGIMIIPFVSSLSDDVIVAVPQSLREGSLGLGATQSETIKKVLIPAALPGIVGSVLLAVSRAIGETMIVVMAAGLAANLTFNPLDAASTVTVQIVTLLVGDQEFDSAKTLAAFALGLTLFFVTLLLNIIALRFTQKYREKYE